jgi:hypothetical protein
MENIKIILKERTSGLLLIMMAVFIVAGISFGSHRAESKNGQNLTGEDQTRNDTHVLGETNNNLEEATGNSEKTPADVSENSFPLQKTPEVKTDDKPRTDLEAKAYNDLRDHLKKYCGKNFDVKKCHDYLLEAKDASKKSAQYKALYKKYHFESKSSSKSDNNTTSSTSANGSNTASTDSKNDTKKIIITSGGDSKSYEIAVSSGASVFDMMDLLQKDSDKNFSYHSSSGFVDKINETGNQGNMSWMLYTCKSDICKLSSVGASECKIGDWDKIEWKYLDWTTVDWTTW